MAQDLDKFRNSSGRIWLNVASSTDVLEDFVNLDNHVFLSLLPVGPLVKFVFPTQKALVEQYEAARCKALLVRHDCRRPLPLPSGSVDHILCSHFLEHVYPCQVRAVLRDFHRALKPGGSIHVVVPDLQAQASRYLERVQTGVSEAADQFLEETLLSGESPGSLKFRFLEFVGSFGLRHRWMYDRASISKKIAEAGFDVLTVNKTPSRGYRQGDGSVHVVGSRS